MKNLKKLFAVILVVAMMASFMIPALAAPSDVVGTDIEQEVSRLVALGIITGREDGKFYPDDTITRAEFAAVVVRALGYGTAADSAKGQTKFTDVAPDFWAAGYINLAVSLGVIKGRPDGTFGANDKVLYEEAVTMVVRAIGYEPAAAANGGYPAGYLAIASQEDIDKDAVAAIGAPASRGLVAQLVDNSLEVAMMVPSEFGPAGQTYVKSGTGTVKKQTLLDTKLKLDVREATVQSTDTAKNEIKVKMLSAADSDKNGTDAGKIMTFDVFDGISFAGLENAKITLWKKDNVVYNIDTDTTLVYDFVTKINGEDDDDYLNATYEGIKDIDFKNAGAGFDVVGDGTKATFELIIDGVAATMNAADSAFKLKDKFVKAYVEKGEIVRLEAFTIPDANVGIVTKVDGDDVTIISGTNDNKKLVDINTGIEKPLVVIDGVAKSYTDLKDDMLIQYTSFTASSDDYYTVIASTKTLSGNLDGAKSGKVTIDGTTTDLTANSYKWYSTDDGDTFKGLSNDSTVELKDLVGEDVFAYVTYRGKIPYIKSASGATTDFYGILEEKGTSLDKRLKIARNLDGEEKDVTYDTDLTTSEWSGLTASTGLPANRPAALYKFKIDADGLITGYDTVGFTNGTPTKSAVNFNKDSDYIRDAGDTSRVYVDSDTIIFQVSRTSVTDTDVKLLKWGDIKGTSFPSPLSSSTLNAYYYGNSGRGDATPEVILLEDSAPGTVVFTTSDIYIGYVKDLKSTSSSEYTAVLNTPTGEQTFKVDEDYLQMPGWTSGQRAETKEKKIVLYTTTTDGYAKISVATETYKDFNPDNTTAGAPTATGLALASNYQAYDNNGAGYALANGAVDGDTIDVATGTVFQLASDAVVYKYNSLRDSYTVSDVSSIDDYYVAGSDTHTSTVSFITYKGKIKMLIYWDE